MDLQIQGKTALITGAGRGLGAAIAQSLAVEGCNIIAVSRGSEALDQLVSGLPSTDKEHIALPIDLLEEEGVSTLLEQIKSRGLSPDIIVNNVGGNLNYTDPLADSSIWRKVFRYNLEIAIDINNAFAPRMQEQKWGRICHISSIAALENQGHPAYCAAKAALNAYVRSVGRYLSPDNVILTSVMPGAVMTDGGYWDQAQQKRPEHVRKYLNERMAIRRFGTPEEISQLVAFCCSESASFCVGSTFLADGGQGKVFHT